MSDYDLRIPYFSSTKYIVPLKYMKLYSKTLLTYKSRMKTYIL
jgi:hypothetical protein